MGQVTITLNSRTYQLECDDGEESHLLLLSEQMAKHIENLTGKFGQAGDDRLLLMAGLTVTDELWEARQQIVELNAKLTQVHVDQASADELVEAAQSELAGMIDATAERIQELSAQLADTGAKN